MSNIKVSQLPTAKKLSGDEHLLGVQSGESVKVSVGQIIENAEAIVDGQVAVAKSAADRAELASDIASSHTGMYPSTTAAAAVLSNGDYFTVPETGSNTYARLYRMTSDTTSEFIASYPSSSAVGVRKQGFILGMGAGSSTTGIEFDLLNHTARFGPSCRVVHPGELQGVQLGEEVNLTFDYPVNSVVYDVSQNTLQVVNAFSSVGLGRVVVGIYSKEMGFTERVSGVPNYRTVNPDTRGAPSGVLMSTGSSDRAVFDATTRTLTIGEYSRLVNKDNNTAYQTPASSITFGTSALQVLTYNIRDNIFETHNSPFSTIYQDRHIVCGYYMHSERELYGIPNLEVKGVANKFGYSTGILIGESDGITFNPDTKVLSVGLARVRYTGSSSESFQVISKTLQLGAAAFELIVADINTSELSVLPATGNIPRDSVLIGTYHRTVNRIYGIDAISGVEPDTRNTFATGVLYGDASLIVLKTENGQKTLEFISSRIVSNSLPNGTVGVAGSIPLPSGVSAIYFDPVSEQFGTTQPHQVDSLPEGSVIFGQYFRSSKYEILSGIPFYSTETDVIASFDVDKKVNLSIPRDVYIDPVKSNYAQYTDIVGSDVSYLFDKYDALAAQAPNYITKSQIGTSVDSNPIYQYHFKPNEPTPVSESSVKKMVLISAIHADERASAYCLYSAMKRIVEDWTSHDILKKLRWNCEFIVIPIVNVDRWPTPSLWGRHNQNGVDLARNFPSGWSLIPTGTSTYGGESPLSEPEAQAIESVMGANRDAVYFGSFHNFFSGDAFIWNADGTKAGSELGAGLITNMSIDAWDEIGWLSEGEFLGYSGSNAPAGSEGYHAIRGHGIPGGTFEVSETLVGFLNSPETTEMSKLQHELGTRAIVNWLHYRYENADSFFV